MKLQDLQKSLKSITSKEISELTGKRHDNILVDVKKLDDVYVKISQLKIQESEYTVRGKTYPMYILTKMQCLDLMTGYNHELRIAVNRRWEQLELQLQSEQQRLHQRNEARLGCPKMTDALQTQRIDSGKETKSYHYSNEHDMIYRIVLGATAKKYKEALGIDGSLRDGLTPLQIEAVRKIQDMNTTLIDLGIEFKSRKESLNTFFNKRFNKRLKDEHDLING